MLRSHLLDSSLFYSAVCFLHHWKDRMKKQLFLSFLAAFILVAAAFYWIFAQNRGPTLGGDFTLTHEGRPWNLKENAKDINLLYVGYAKCPDVCPMALSYTSQAFKELSGDDLHHVQMIFISVDATHDTPESVSTYAKQFHPTFVGLTGKSEQIDQAIKLFGASYMIEENKKSYLGYSIAHTDRLYILNKKGIVLDTIPSPRSTEEIVQKIKENL